MCAITWHFKLFLTLNLYSVYPSTNYNKILENFVNHTIFKDNIKGACSDLLIWFFLTLYWSLLSKQTDSNFLTKVIEIIWYTYMASNNFA